MMNSEGVIEERARSPCATLQQIGDRFGITRERVRQVLKRGGKDTCNAKFRYYKEHPRTICPDCGGVKGGSAQRCWRCWQKSRLIPVACSYCGQITMRNAKRVINDIQKGAKYFFCNHHCRGKWLGHNHGFRPGNRITKPRKWDYELVWQTHLDTGYGLSRLSRLLNIPRQSIGGILRKMRWKQGI